MNEISNDCWIGLEEAANYLGVKKETVRNWIKKTDIPAHKIGKLCKFKRRYFKHTTDERMWLF